MLVNDITIRSLVVKKLVVFDSCSNIAVHVALDNILVLSDVRTIATLAPAKDAIKLITEENDVNESYLTLVNESTALDDQKFIESFFKLESCVGVIEGHVLRLTMHFILLASLVTGWYTLTHTTAALR
ncbi:hypothetical protein Aduo_006413 [Ancylostoma duodenale]